MKVALLLQEGHDWSPHSNGNTSAMIFENSMPLPDQVFQSVDVLMTPTSPNTAFEFGSKGTQNPVELYLEDLFTISSNLAGLPAISIPHGQVNSLPVGLQLIGNFLKEDQLLNTAHLFQKNSDFHLAQPSLEDFS